MVKSRKINTNTGSNRRHHSCATIASYSKLRFSFSDLIVVTAFTKKLTTFRPIGGTLVDA